MSGDIVEIANAKINLSLRVIGKRSDGYHQLESLVVFADIADTLICREADELSLEISGPFGKELAAEDDNLILKAGRIFATASGCDAKLGFTLEKNLPIASGVGGGSADAAAALRAMTQLWGTPPGSIQDLALQLGADVPVCLAKRPSFMSGIGETVTPVSNLPELYAVLVNPGVAVSTAEVFKRLGAGPIAADHPSLVPCNVETLNRLLDWLAANGNDLEAPAIHVAPIIADVLAQLAQSPGCRLARMSGSGATCFALYENSSDAAKAAAQINEAEPTWWVQPTKLSGS